MDSTAVSSCWEGRGHLTWMRGTLCTPAGHTATDAAGALEHPQGVGKVRAGRGSGDQACR